MDKENLIEFGFSKGEADIYLALLKLGPSSVLKLAKETGRHRTHIYDTLEKLQGKGLVSFTIEDNKKAYLAANPENLFDVLKEKEEKLKEVIPNLKKITGNIKKEILIETYKGIFGLKSVLRDILKEKKDYLGYGEGVRFQKILPIFFKQFLNQAEKLGLGLRLIIRKGAKIPKRKKLKVRYLSEDFTPPATTFIYGNRISIILWEPFPCAIRIVSEQIAETYRKYFNLIWKIAK